MINKAETYNLLPATLPNSNSLYTFPSKSLATDDSCTKESKDSPLSLPLPLPFALISAIPKLPPLSPFADDKTLFNLLKVSPGEWLPAIAPLKDGYEKVRLESLGLVKLTRTFDDKIADKVSEFIKLDIDKSTLLDVDEGISLLGKISTSEKSISLKASTVTTCYQIKVGQVANILQALVKKHKLGNWKTYFQNYFPNISYETLNIWKNVAAIPMVEKWNFLGIWKLNQLRLAAKELGINTNDPIKTISDIYGSRLTESITEKDIIKFIEKEKFKKTISINQVELDDEIINDLSACDVPLTTSLAANLVSIQKAGGTPQVHAEEILANKGSEGAIKKIPTIPMQISFDNQVAPLLDTLNIILNTKPTEVTLDFKRFDELLKIIILVNNHLSQNPYKQAA